MHARASLTGPVGSSQPKPYLIAGAGRLSAAVWKTVSETGEADYQFNVFLLDPMDGSVVQRFSASDVVDLAKLAHVLAAVLLDDGCVESALQRALRSLVDDLETVFCRDAE